jgi:hypothetical protein
MEILDKSMAELKKSEEIENIAWQNLFEEIWFTLLEN